jgi:hypothetical protein
MPCYQSTTLPSGVTATGRTGYRTEAECNQACKEGACCEGTTCSVKPQCQCQGAGKTFKGVGTTCTPNPCGRCGCTTGIVNAQTITLSLSGASLLFSPQDSGAFGYEQMRNGGSCVNDSSVVQWLNGITVALSDTTVDGVQAWRGQATTESHLSPVVVQCVLLIFCGGSAGLTVTYCPDGASQQTCMRRHVDANVGFQLGNPCTASSGTASGYFSQAVAEYSTAGCRSGAGGLVAIRGFGFTYTINANPLP